MIKKRVELRSYLAPKGKYFLDGFAGRHVSGLIWEWKDF